MNLVERHKHKRDFMFKHHFRAMLKIHSLLLYPYFKCNNNLAGSQKKLYLSTEYKRCPSLNAGFKIHTFFLFFVGNCRLITDVTYSNCNYSPWYATRTSKALLMLEHNTITPKKKILKHKRNVI